MGKFEVIKSNELKFKIVKSIKHVNRKSAV